LTCEDFKSTLKVLSQMGLKLDLTSEKPIELNSIVSISSKQREKLNAKQKVQEDQIQQKIKKYLN
jgi:hypothetical protein